MSWPDVVGSGDCFEASDNVEEELVVEAEEDRCSSRRVGVELRVRRCDEGACRRKTGL